MSDWVNRGQNKRQAPNNTTVRFLDSSAHVDSKSQSTSDLESDVESIDTSNNTSKHKSELDSELNSNDESVVESTSKSTFESTSDSAIPMNSEIEMTFTHKLEHVFAGPSEKPSKVYRGFYFDPDVIKALDSIAKKKDRGFKSDVVNKALRLVLEQYGVLK